MSLEAREFVRVGTTNTVFPGSAAEAREMFEAHDAVAIRQMLEPALLTILQRLCDTGTFISGPSDPGHREVEAPQRAGRALNLMLQRPAFLSWLSEVTQCGPIASVEGRVAQTRPRPGDELVWHDDLDADARLLAIVINLGSEPYLGGDFELRPKNGATTLRFHHQEAGSALIFRIHPTLEHRVLPVSSGGPRRVFAGWALSRRSSSQPGIQEAT